MSVENAERSSLNRRLILSSESLSVEKTVLAKSIQDQNCLDTALEVLRPDDFKDIRLGKLHDLMGSMRINGEPINLLTLQEKLPNKTSWLAEITNHFQHGSQQYYCGIVKDSAIRNKVLLSWDNVSQEIIDPTNKPSEVLEDYIKTLSDLSSQGSGSYYTPREAADIHKAALTKTREGGSLIFSGIDSVDLLTQGHQKQDNVVIAARTSLGKTAFALTLAYNLSNEGTPVGFFSLEMSVPQLLNRLVAHESGIPHRSIRSGKITSWDMDEYHKSIKRISALPLYIDDRSGLTIPQIRSTARQMKRQEGIQAIFVDYVGLVRPTDRRISRFDHISEASRALKAIARELDITVFVLSQLNRLAEGGRPSLAHLRESGSLEQDADTVLFLHSERESYSQASVVSTELIVAKNRNGQTGSVKIGFHPEFQYFSDFAGGNS